MKLKFRKAKIEELPISLSLLKQAAETLQQKEIDQWTFWLNPTDEKVNWIKEGFLNQEFFFVENNYKEIVGMFRLLDQDGLYWGKQSVRANYIHSLVVDKKFAGKNIGNSIISLIETTAINNGVFRIRLDCNASNPALCSYYERLNFIKVGEKQMPHSLNTLYEKELLNDFPLKILIGVWKGSGQGMYPTINSFSYDEKLTFEFLAEKKRLFYFQKADFTNTNELAHIETGFINQIDSNKFELNNAQSGGRNEALLIEVIENSGNELKLKLTQLNISNDKKGLLDTEREITVSNDQLDYKQFMQTTSQTKQLHLQARLLRQKSQQVTSYWQ